MKNSDYKLGITYYDVEFTFRQMQKIFIKQYDVILEKDNHAVLSRGHSDIEQKKAWIGERGIDSKEITKYLENPKVGKRTNTIKPKTKITDTAFVLFITSGFHELQHFEQSINELQGKSYLIDEKHHEMDILMGIQCLANSTNRLYYEKNYKYNIAEVDAERHSFQDSFVFLKNVYPDKENELKEVFVNVYNYKASAYRHWLYNEHQIKKFETIEDIKTAFDNVMQKLQDKKYVAINSSYPSPRGDAFTKGQEESINQALAKIEKYSNEYKEWDDIYCSVIGARGYRADRELAAIVNYLKPELKQKYAVLNDVDLSMTTVFGIEPPEIGIESKIAEGKTKTVEQEYFPNVPNLAEWLRKDTQITEKETKAERTNPIEKATTYDDDDGPTGR